uniref:Leukotriene A(4) hydrolase n=2 Tax=Eptatretus burgeri TaxID=7764 RepID=A0A8C4WU63_EPTBU
MWVPVFTLRKLFELLLPVLICVSRNHCWNSEVSFCPHWTPPPPPAARATMDDERVDSCSFSCPHDVHTVHLSLKLRVHFETHVVHGVVRLSLLAVRDTPSVVLDTKGLQIKTVTASNGPASFSVRPAHAALGSALEITLSSALKRDDTVEVKIEYETSPSALALQWLTPEQTAGKKFPYLFSQCQAIHCRCMVPCQDTPSVKSTYDAQVSVPNGMVALMSAIRDGSDPDPDDALRTVFKFKQPVLIPSYLLALVVGALESRKIGPRSYVWSEKDMVDKAAFEFAETEKILQVAESLVGKYVWCSYDLLILPPSFPYGGMENPCITFVTPTLIAGDRSLAGVVAHEIAHSWTGNLVTNNNWEHFWLNEGHTMYLERLICGKMLGEPLRQLEAIEGWNRLKDSVKVFGEQNPLTNLIPNLDGIDPDDAFSSVPYEKGFGLLLHLEQLLGGQEVFVGFVKSYIDKFAYQSVTSEDWKNHLYEYFKDKNHLLENVDWKGWFYSPGMPPVQPKYDTSLADACLKLVDQWIKAGDENLHAFGPADLKDMHSFQVIYFLSELLQAQEEQTPPPFSLKHVQMMQQAYNLNDVTNYEIRFRWLCLCLQAKWENAIPLALRMVTEQGRMKYIRPLYRYRKNG